MIVIMNTTYLLSWDQMMSGVNVEDKRWIQMKSNFLFGRGAEAETEDQRSKGAEADTSCTLWRSICVRSNLYCDSQFVYLWLYFGTNLYKSDPCCAVYLYLPLIKMALQHWNWAIIAWKIFSINKTSWISASWNLRPCSAAAARNYLRTLWASSCFRGGNLVRAQFSGASSKTIFEPWRRKRRQSSEDLVGIKKLINLVWSMRETQADVPAAADAKPPALHCTVISTALQIAIYNAIKVQSNKTKCTFCGGPQLSTFHFNCTSFPLLLLALITYTLYLYLYLYFFSASLYWYLQLHPIVLRYQIIASNTDHHFM